MHLQRVLVDVADTNSIGWWFFFLVQAMMNYVLDNE